MSEAIIITMTFETIQEYYSHVKGRIARSGYTDDWNAVRLVPFSGKTGVVRALPLQFKDGAVLRFSEEIILDKFGNVFRPNYSYQVDRLLRRDAKMTVENAIKALSDELQIKIPSDRRSFRDQILYLCKNTEGSVIINAAHKIHNDMIGKKNKSHWPLKEKQQ